MGSDLLGFFRHEDIAKAKVPLLNVVQKPKSRGGRWSWCPGWEGEQGRDTPDQGRDERAQLCPVPPIMMFQLRGYKGSTQSSFLFTGNIRNDPHYWFMCKQLKRCISHCNAKLCTSINGTLDWHTRIFRSLLTAWDKSCKCFDFPEQMSPVSQHELQYSATVNSRTDW